ncbi:MAG: hypothetical protein ACFCBW_07465 [Candidatus Competibacterales bacterium]
MKVTLDLGRLLEEGKISPAEYQRFQALASEGTRSVALNALMGFGIAAVAGGALAWFPEPTFAVVAGAVVMGLALYTRAVWSDTWDVLAAIALITGALMFAGGVIVEGEGAVVAFAAVGLLFALVGVIARSALLTAMAVLAFASCLGARTGYFHASYFLGVETPLVTALVFTVVGIAAYQLSRQLTGDYRDLAIVAARTGAFLVNLALWVGSLWGDVVVVGSFELSLPAPSFAIIWALALGVAIAWAVRANRRWLVNVGVIFAAIHFYTQWFEHLEAAPETVLGAGLFTIAAAVALSRYNLMVTRRGVEGA